MEFVSFLAITVIAYFFGMAAKNIPYIKDEWIPVICMAVGGVFGVIAFYVGTPDFPAHDFINALAVGIWSGFGATAVNQIVKQRRKEKL